LHIQHSKIDLACTIAHYAVIIVLSLNSLFRIVVLAVDSVLCKSDTLLTINNYCNLY